MKINKDEERSAKTESLPQIWTTQRTISSDKSKYIVRRWTQANYPCVHQGALSTKLSRLLNEAEAKWVIHSLIGPKQCQWGHEVVLYWERDEDNGGRLPCIMGTDTKNLETRDPPVGKKDSYWQKETPRIGIRNHCVGPRPILETWQQTSLYQDWE